MCETRDGEEWKNARYGVVTGTDVARILGMDPSVSRRKLFECKLAHVEPTQKAGPYLQRLLELGKIYEPVARECFVSAAAGGMACEVPGMKTHPAHSWLNGTPDLFLLDGAGRVGSVVEIKCHFHPAPHRALPYACVKELPLRHWLQLQTYMEIMNVDTGYVWSWTLYNGATLFRVERMARGIFEQCIVPVLSHFYTLLRTYFSNECPKTAPKEVLDSLVYRNGTKAIIEEILQQQFDETVTFAKRYPN